MKIKNLIRKLFFWIAYYKNPPWDTGISPPELMRFISTHPPGKAIDLGCGTGTNVITLAKHGWQVVGLDYIPKAIHTARRKIRQSNVEAIVQIGDVTRPMKLSEDYDLALDIGCYHNLSLEGKITYEFNLNHLLKHGGTYLLYGFLSTSQNATGISEADVARLCKFLILEERQEGSDRNRPSAWFRFVKPPAL